MNDKPWKIINEYIWFNEQTHLITIPIITHSLQSIKAGEPICHIRLTEPEHILQNTIKGWYFIEMREINVTTREKNIEMREKKIEINEINIMEKKAYLKKREANIELGEIQLRKKHKDIH